MARNQREPDDDPGRHRHHCPDCGREGNLCDCHEPDRNNVPCPECRRGDR